MVTHTPQQTNGTETTAKVSVTEPIPSRDSLGMNGTWMCTRKATTMASENSNALRARCSRDFAGSKIRGDRKTNSAPTVIPNMAIDMAMKAKWYHMVTLKILVSRISNISIDRVTRKRPA